MQNEYTTTLKGEQPNISKGQTWIWVSSLPEEEYQERMRATEERIQRELAELEEEVEGNKARSREMFPAIIRERMDYTDADGLKRLVQLLSDGPLTRKQIRLRLRMGGERSMRLLNTTLFYSTLSRMPGRGGRSFRVYRLTEEGIAKASRINSDAMLSQGMNSAS